MSIIIRNNWGIRRNEKPIGKEYLYSYDYDTCSYQWGKDARRAMKFDTLEEAQTYAWARWTVARFDTFEYLDTETKEVVSSGNSMEVHTETESEGRDPEPASTE